MLLEQFVSAHTQKQTLGWVSPWHSQPTELMAACPSCAGGHRAQLMPFPPLPLLEGADPRWRGRSGREDGHLWGVQGVRCTQPPQPNLGSKWGQEFL